MNDKAHMQTQNGFIWSLRHKGQLAILHGYKNFHVIREPSYKEDINRGQGWKMNANRKSDTPLGTSHPLNYYQENLEARIEGGGREMKLSILQTRKF